MKARAPQNTGTNEKDSAKRAAMTKAQSEVDWLVKMKSTRGHTRKSNFDDDYLNDDKEEVEMEKDEDDAPPPEDGDDE